MTKRHGILGFDISPVTGLKTGVEYYALRLYAALKEILGAGHIVAFSNHAVPEVPEAVVLGSSLPGSLWRQLLPLHFRHYGIDSFHSPVTAAPYLTRVPRFATVHDMCFLQECSPEARKQLLACRLAAEKCAGVICVSEATCRDLRANVSPQFAEKCVAVHSGALVRDVPMGNDVKNNVSGRYFLQVGRIDKRKNPLLVLDAFAESGVANRFSLVLAGAPGDATADVERWLENHSRIAAKVICTGYLPENRLGCLLRGADALLYPSENEGFGHPPFEALSVGVLPVVRNIPVLRETLGQGAAVFAARDVIEWADVLRKIAGNTLGKGEILAAGRKRIAELTWRKTAEKVIELHCRAGLKAGV